MGGWKRLTALWLALLYTGCQATPAPDEAAGGKFMGYTYSETPVVDASTPVDYGYAIKFRAYDLGGDARFVVYAQREKTGEYYAGVIRLGIQDPDGNAYTFYHSTEGEPIDQPILWTRRTPGMHRVNITFSLRPDQNAEANFDVPLVFEPVSPVLIGGVIAAVVAGVIVLVLFLRKRQIGV